MSILTDKQRSKVIQIATSKLVFAMHHATIEQQAYVESTGLNGRAKFTYSAFFHAGNSFIKEWEKTPQMFEQS